MNDDAVTWLRRLVKTVMSAKPNALDTHWAPQFEYVRNIKLDYVLPIERLDLLESMVTARSGQRLQIEHRNVRSKNASVPNRVEPEVRKLIEECYWIDRGIYENAKRSTKAVADRF